MKEIIRTYSSFNQGSLMSINTNPVTFLQFYDLFDVYFNSRVLTHKPQKQ